MTTLESLAEVTSNRIAAKTGLIEPGFADEFMLRAIVRRSGYLSHQQYPEIDKSRDIAESMKALGIVGVAKAVALFGRLDGSPGDRIDSTIWVTHSDWAVGHEDIEDDFESIVEGKWRHALGREVAGGYLVETESGLPTILIDDCFPDDNALPETSLLALDRASALLPLAQICIAHIKGRYTLINDGVRTVMSYRDV